MSGRALPVLTALLMLTALLPVTPTGSAEMNAPTISVTPTINGQVEETEWSDAERSSWGSPFSGTSTVRVGYLDDKNQLAMGIVLADDTDHEKDRVHVLIAPRRVNSGDGLQSEDIKLTIWRDGSWQRERASGGNWTFDANGDRPTQTDGDVWSFANENSAASWEVELVATIGDFEADDEIRVSIIQTDFKTNTEQKTTAKGSQDEKEPDKWERTILSGRPVAVTFQVRPEKMEAAVGGDILVSLPSDSKGGRLTVQVKEPGSQGFTPIANVDNGAPGVNRFFFSPEKVGTYGIQAVWNGDGNYGKHTTDTFQVAVSRPDPAGPSIMETGSMRVAFPPEAAGSEAVWEYTNTKVWATDGQGNQLPLVHLDKSNSCRGKPWVGFANVGNGPLVLHFDPPVRRAPIAMTSPQDSFTATWRAFNSDGEIKPGSERTAQGSCSNPVFAGVGEVEGDVERITVDFTGDDTREVVDVVFPYPIESTPPKVTVRADPSPLHAGGFSTIHASAGSPHRLAETTVTVTSGAATLGQETCSSGTTQPWIQCPVDVELPPNAGSIRVEVASEDRFGGTFETTETIRTTSDNAPPKVQMLPRPLVAPPGGTVAMQTVAEDGSGLQNVTVRAVDGEGEEIASETCTPVTPTQMLECRLGVSQAESGFTFVKASATDRAGNSVTVGPKPVPVRGTDGDGDGLPDALELEIGTSPSNPDTDGDGLSDGWEVVGVDRNGDGQSELDLASLGADPQLRDLFVEFDWAEHDGHSHEVDYAAIQLLRNVLASRGIQLHTDVQQEGGPFDPARFDHGHPVHKHLLDHERAGIYMHVIAGHMGGPAAGGAGTIYLPTQPTDDQLAARVGAQLLHEVGHHLGLGHGGGGTITKDNQELQAAYQEDYKPNYLSVMNDAYAWGIIVDTVDGLVRVPTLSGVTVGDLDESALNEPEGLSFNLGTVRDSLRAGPTHALDEDSLTGLRVRYTCPDMGPVRWAFVPGSVDWNCDGASEDTGVEVDINRGGANTGIGTLVSRADWDALDLEGPSCPQYALMLPDALDLPADDGNHGASYEPLGLAPCPLRPPAETPLESEPEKSAVFVQAPQGDLEEPDQRDNDQDGVVDEGFADTDGDGVVNLIDDCPSIQDASQSDRDRNGRGDICQDRPGRIAGLNTTADPETASVDLQWEKMSGVWGYNVYRISGNEVTRLGSSFPTTQQPVFVDPAGSGDVTYLVTAVNGLAQQGPPATISTVADNGGDDGGTSGGQEGVPGLGAFVVLALVGAVAAVARRRGRST